MSIVPGSFDEQMMRRAIRLAMNGRGSVEPNPMVGCVIVKGGRVIGEGYHHKFGQAHAEPNALANCTESPAGATAYVTLEPCCHTNKKTPPCTPRLIEAKVAQVVVGCVDPNAEVNGKGLRQLREAGIEVIAPVMEGEAKQLIAPFLAREKHRGPYVTLKWAQTADGKVAGPGGARLHITNPLSTRLVHELRARCDAIMVGINTVLSDDPILTARNVPDARPMLRYVLDRRLRIPLESQLVQSARAVPLVIGIDLRAAKPDKVLELKSLGAMFFPTPWLERAMVDLYTRFVTHVLVEPGPTLAKSFFERNLADRVWVFQSPKTIAADDAPFAAEVPTRFVKTGSLGLDGDTLTEYLNPQSPVFFAPEPSADFVLAAGEQTQDTGEAPAPGR